MHTLYYQYTDSTVAYATQHQVEVAGSVSWSKLLYLEYRCLSQQGSITAGVTVLRQYLRKRAASKTYKLIC